MKKTVLCLMLLIISFLLFSCKEEEEPTITYPVITSNVDGTSSYYWGDTKPTILTFGDSIASGYALKKTSKRYSTLLSTLTNTKEENKAVAGYDSSDLLAQLDRMTSDNRNVIFVSIGANNILGVVSSKLDSYKTTIGLAVATKNTEAIANAMKQVQNDFESDTMETNFLAGVSLFEEELPKIIDKMHQMWPNTPIFIQTIYNPYVGFVYGDDLDMESVSDKYIVMLNNIIKANCDNYSFLYLVDIYEAFENSQDDYINANFSLDSNFNFDPHPNDLGHQKICDTYFSVWENLNYIRSE